MQRTVKSIIFTYVKNDITDNGEITSKIEKVRVNNETNEKKAYRNAVKVVGNFVPVKTEIEEKLYVLDDEIFFKYAKPIED